MITQTEVFMLNAILHLIPCDVLMTLCTCFLSCTRFNYIITAIFTMTSEAENWTSVGSICFTVQSNKQHS